MANKYHILNPTLKKETHTYDLEGISPFDAGIPLLDISDSTIEEIYYFRWHTFCHHIKTTPEGYVITEFYPPVPWAGKYNTINCPAMHHFNEGRWLYNREYLSDYAKFWFTEDAERRKYSFPAAYSILEACRVWNDFTIAESLYEPMKENYFEWKRSHGRECGLFYQTDNRDGMEYSVSGPGFRPTINSYMYAESRALSEIATRKGFTKESEAFALEAKKLRELINTRLWDENAQFYKNLAERKNYTLADVREEIGYIPWCFNIPEKRMSVAWKFLNDENYFAAPYGPTTAERNHPDFMKEFDHECLWNGPSWPFATCQTIGAMANLLKNHNGTYVTKSDLFALLKQYASCQYITENGEKRPFIDENLDPFTGEWLARKILHSIRPIRDDADRGRDYNHSTFCDLVITCLCGISVEGGVIAIDPLFGENDIDYICLDGVSAGTHSITLLWDKNGLRYGKGTGLHIYVDGTEYAHSDSITKISIQL
ncbi:MAG: hypothetical protein IKV97_01590 [Clostridia bacterium]|nr:hypothetical protein [Clostridia bacterium]